MKKGWESKKLGEMCEFQRGLTYAKGDEVDVSNNVVLRAANINLATNLLTFDELKYISDKVAVPESKKVKKNSLLICTASGSKSHLGKVAFIDDDYGYAFGGFMGLLTPLDGLLPKYLFHLMTSDNYKDFIAALSDGVNINNLKFDELKQFPIPIPPFPEQQRIVGILDEAFDGIATVQANTEKNLQNTRALFESHLNDVFTQRGEEWVEKRLEEVLAVQPQNGWSPPAANHADSGIPVLTLSSVTGFVFRQDKVKFTSAATDQKARYWVQNGDLLITRSNTPELVGHVAIVSGVKKPTVYPDLIMRMNPDPAKALPEFLYYQMRSPALRKEISGRSQGANPTMKKISNGAVRTLPIRVPPLAVQNTIVILFDALAAEIKRLESIYQQKLAALEALKKSLLHQAFSGEL